MGGMKVRAYEPPVSTTIECQHCHETKTVTVRPGVVKLYCSEPCKHNAGNRRRLRRRMRELRGEAVPCPTPDKVPYETEYHARVVANNQLVANGKRLYVHNEVCDCGSWHLSSLDAPVPDVPAPPPRPSLPPEPALSPEQVELLREHFHTGERR